MSRGWRLHGILLGIALLLAVRWAVSHRSDAEWLAAWRTGTGQERLSAAHVLLNRGARAGAALRAELTQVSDPGQGPDDLSGQDPGTVLLTTESDPRVRTLAFSSDLCKLGSARPQLRAVLAGLERGEPSALLDFVLQCRKVGGESVGASSAMRRAEVDWMLRARGRDSWTASEREELARHLEPWLAPIRQYLEEAPR